MIAFRRVLNWVGLGGLTRQEGLQSAQPSVQATTPPVAVTFDTSMQLSAVWACVKLLSETIACLPVDFTMDGKPFENDISDVFTGRSNRYQTSTEFKETMALNLVTTGNAFAFKQQLAGRIVGLLPIMSGQMEVKLLQNGDVVYIHYHDKGVDVIAAENIWHVKLFGNGVTGMSPLAYGATTMGIALAGERRVSQILKNGAKPSGILTIDKLLKDAQRKQIKREFSDLQEGNGDTLMVLEADMKYAQVSMTPSDIQLLDSRRFSIEDIARFFGVPSVLINDTSGTTVWGSGIFEIVQGFYKLNLRPYLVRMEESIRLNLLEPGDRRRVRVRFNLDDLLRASPKDRAEANEKRVQSGQLTPNEARRKEDLGPLPGGDDLFVNAAMTPIRLAGRPTEKPTGTN